MPLQYPTTSRTLLARIAAGDEIGWDEFYGKYAPIVRAVARCKGLDSVADDICQQVMLEFFKQSRTFRFDPDKARFRTYFGRIVRARIADHYRRNRELPAADAPPPAVEPEVERIFLSEWREMALREAEAVLKSRVAPKTFQAYRLYAAQGRPAEKVAAFLECSVNQVYLAKKRCVVILRELLAEMNDADPDLQVELPGDGN